MAHDHKQKTMLHELLKEDQEPFHLSKYISQKRSMLRRSRETLTHPKSKSLPIKQRAAGNNNLCRRACFFALHSSNDDVTKSPFLELRSPPVIRKSPSSSPNGAVFLEIPSRIASVLLEAALRIQKPKPRPRSSSHAGFGLFGSFLKRIKSKSKKHDLKSTLKQVEQRVKTVSSSSSSPCVDWTESHCEDSKSLDLEPPSTSGGYDSEEDDNSTENGDFDFPETRFCMSPFVFSVRRSPSSSGGCTPAGSPGRHVVIQENANNNEEKEQCSPVSVLDPPLDEDDDKKEDEEAEEGEEEDDDDYDIESSYANVQRAKQQLLLRLRRFERLADLDPIELERKLMQESSDDEYQVEEFEPNLSENEVLLLDRSSNLLQHSHSTDDHRSKRPLLSNAAIDVNFEIICTRLDSKREVGFNTIDMMMELDLKRESGEWSKLKKEVDETAQDLEVLIFDLLMEELI